MGRARHAISAHCQPLGEGDGGSADAYCPAQAASAEEPRLVNPVQALREIGFLLERSRADPYRGRAYRGGHEYCAISDHSPRLQVARGLSADRLREQIAVVADLDKVKTPFRCLRGIEVDILEEGTLDQEDVLLAELDIVVSSVHSKLRSDS